MVRSGWCLEAGSRAYNEDGHCFLETHFGRRCLGPSHDWERMQGATEQGDRIGMLLDLDQGSMTI